MDVREFMKENILLLDGGFGTMLQQKGLPLGTPPDIANITSPEIVREIHGEYFAAGSLAVMSNTFGANARKLEGTGYSVEAVISAAIENARLAANGRGGLVALDIGPLGELMEPMGTLKWDEAYELFREQILAGVRAGADFIAIETMTELSEARCAILAAKENSDLPLFCTMSFEAAGRTFAGVSLASMALTISGLGVDALGINCSVGPKEMLSMVEELQKWTNIPIIVKPNAGLPKIVGGRTVFDVSAEEFTEYMGKLLDLGVGIVGGCCGTTPEFIARLAGLVRGRKPRRGDREIPAAVCSYAQCVPIDRVRIVGERINPTGKRRFREALEANDMDYVAREAISQIESGAEILDVNVGLPKADETALMLSAVAAIQAVADAPLQIDSSKPEVIEAALRRYNGKAIVNSVSGEKSALFALLPIVKKYGAMVVGLTLDEGGIPKTAEGRLEIAERIVGEAAAHGIPKKDIIIDCLTLTAGAAQETAYETVRAVEMVKSRLGVKTTLGVSNISFGLPAREILNSNFLAIALSRGLDLPIINPGDRAMTDAVYCFHQLTNADAGSREYTARFSAERAGRDNAAAADLTLEYCVEKGLREDIKAATAALLEKLDGMEIVSDRLIPALDRVGKSYESGKTYLPQLLQAAEAAKAAFEVIKSKMPKDAESAGDAAGDKGIILATVKGDVHDIGKNIVKVVLQNYGFPVLDLGRDVPVGAVTDAVVAAGASDKTRLVGLSALMTTTVESMEKTIAAIRELGLPVKVMVGGAVLTEELALAIGADFYAKDALAAVRIAREVLG